MNSTQRIESVNCNQLQSIKQIADQSFSKRWTEKDFAYFLAHQNGLCIGGYEGEMLVAYFLGLLVQGDLDVISIAVDPIARRKGWGEKLLREALSAQSVERSFLEVDSENGAAIALYQKLGFAISGKRKGYYQGIKDAILMHRQKK